MLELLIGTVAAFVLGGAGFPLVLGAIVHEGTPAPQAALHGGDWLLKLLPGVIVGHAP